MQRRLATKLIVALTVIVAIVKVASYFANLESEQGQLETSMIRGADQLSRSITSATWNAMLLDHREGAYLVMNTIAEKQGIDRIRMFNKDGRLMFSTQPDERVHLDKRAEVCSPCHVAATPLIKVDVPNRARVFRGPDGNRRIAMITPIYNEPSCSQASCHAHPESVTVLGVLDLTLDASGLDNEMGALKFRTALLGLIEVAVIAGFLIVFTRRFVERPIRKLVEGTNAVAEMQLDQPIHVESSEELDHLAHSFNLMRERLREAMAENAAFTQRLETKVEERTAQLRSAQQKLMQADRLSSLGQLAASVAHEINNPIAGVLNLSMLMQRIVKDDGIPDGRVEEFRKYLGQVASESARVGRIVSDLLSFSRRARPQKTAVDVNSIVRTTVSLVTHKLTLAGVEAELELDDNLAAIRGDSSQIQQVVMNLVLNGAEAIKGHGKVTVRTRMTAERRGVVLEVVDTGSGIAPELLDKIFDPFFTTKEDVKGVGLGLAVVYGIVRSHRGEIEIDSRVGQGTTFRVTWPVDATEAALASAGSDGTPSWQ